MVLIRTRRARCSVFIFSFLLTGVDAFAGSAGGCISMGLFDANDHFDYSGALGRALDLGVPVTLYYGKSDTVRRV